MWRATWKSLMARKLRLFMSTFAIVLGVAFVVGSLVFSDTLERSFNGIFASSVGDANVVPAGNQVGQGSLGLQSIPASAIEEAKEAPGAARVDGFVQAIGLFVVGKDGKLIGGQAPGIATNYSEAPSAAGDKGFELVSGGPPVEATDVVLDKRTAELAELEVGDQVQFAASGGFTIPDGTLTGIADFDTGLNGATLTMVPLETMQEALFKGEDLYNTIWVQAKPGVSQKELKEEVAERVTAENVKVKTGAELVKENGDALKEALTFITTFLLVFAAISLIVGIYLIVNTFSILLAQRTRELALLRALGASRAQVRRTVLGEAFVVGMIGSALGVLAGLGLAVLLKVLFGQLGLDLGGQGLAIEPRAYLAAFAVGVPVTMLAAYFPARRTSKIAPVQALSDTVMLPQASLTRRAVLGVLLILAGSGLTYYSLFGEPESNALSYLGAGLLGVLLGVTALSPMLSKPLLGAARLLYEKLFGAVGNLAGQNGLRNPRRTAATAAALMITMALVTTLATLSDSTKSSVDELIGRSYTGDFVVSNPQGQTFSPEVAEKMEAVPEVERVASFARQFIDDGEYGFITVGTSEVTDWAGEYSLDVESGADQPAPGNALLQREFAEDNDLKVGDSFTLDLPSGNEKYKVGGIFKTDNVLMDGWVLLTPQDFDEAKLTRDLLFSTIYTTDTSEATYDKLKEVVADDPLVTVKDQQDLADEAKDPINQILLIISALLGLALIIGVLGVVNTLALSAFERTRELGLLRAIGLTQWQTRSMVGLESIVICVLGALLGIGIGIPFGAAILYALRDEGLEVITFPWIQLVLFLVVAIVIGVIAALLPAYRAARIDVLEAIATE